MDISVVLTDLLTVSLARSVLFKQLRFAQTIDRASKESWATTKRALRILSVIEL